LTIRVAPSILSADFAALGAAVSAVDAAGADLIHVDVMDGHFVPNITVGPLVVRALRRVVTRPLDVHLMIEQPERYVPVFIEAGASMVSVHAEASPHLHRTLQLIRSLGARAGVALNPATPVTQLEDVAGEVDFVLLMTVNPGFGGQAFIERSTSRIRALRSLLDHAGSAAPIEVDGGIDAGTAPRVVAAGAEILVAGHAIFGQPDPAGAMQRIRAAALAAVPAAERA
jgi:ribulose-phosphate 3-epimerase